MSHSVSYDVTMVPVGRYQVGRILSGCNGTLEKCHMPVYMCVNIYTEQYILVKAPTFLARQRSARSPQRGPPATIQTTMMASKVPTFGEEAMGSGGRRCECQSVAKKWRTTPFNVHPNKPEQGVQYKGGYSTNYFTRCFTQDASHCMHSHKCSKVQCAPPQPHLERV